MNNFGNGISETAEWNETTPRMRDPKGEAGGPNQPRECGTRRARRKAESNGQTIARGFNPGNPATNMTKSRRDGRMIPRFSGTLH